MLINNAAIQQNLNFLYLDRPQLIQQELLTNLFAPMALCQGLIPLLAQQQRARIINIGSVLALSPNTDTPVYNASKAGVRNFTRSLRQQLHSTSINVVEVIPPVTRTRLGDTQKRRSGLSPETVAQQIILGLKRNRNPVAIGKARLGICLHRWFPKALDVMIARG